MKKLTAMALILAMVLSLSACGSKSDGESSKAGNSASDTSTADTSTADGQETTSISEEEMYPAAIDPVMIHPGSLNGDEDLDSTSDKWYADGDTSSDHFFRIEQMSTEQSNIGRDIEYCKDHEEGYLFSGCPLQGKDGHAVGDSTLKISGEEDTMEFDLTFQDDFTCYNWKTGTVWKRCHPTAGAKDVEWYDKAFAGNTAYVEWTSASYERIKFNEDHTFIEEHDDDPEQTYTGTWEVKATNVIWLHFDDPVAANVPQPSGLDISGEFLGVETETANEDEPLIDYVPQEFEIDDSGKITAFGLYPVYNTDGSTEYKATYCFGTEEEIEEQLQAKNAGAAGQPEDYNDLTASDLAGDPDEIIEKGDNDAASTFQMAMMGDDIGGKIVEIHGTVNVLGSAYSIIVPEEGTSFKTTFNLYIANKPSADELPKDDEEAVVKAVVWKVNNMWSLVTDAEHFTAE